ncbi:MAG: polyprenyl diphosphate synthase [Oscillospiraceae bacterium]|nr:polyprenyl diphosphate synthase [Oscillospiraceae bacterium]
MDSGIPKHVAIIMDGNGRWAQKRGLPRSAGHARGAETFRKIATACKESGVKYLTVYTFSTENWKRPADEVSSLMSLLRKYLAESIDSMERDGIRLKFLGDVGVMPPDILQLIRHTDDISKRVDGMQANVCLKYGGRAEITRAALRAHAALSSGELKELDEDAFSSFLDSSGIPDPDLIIRTAGELRLSNFLLWQAAYAELVFVDALWPDFTVRHLKSAFGQYSGRVRRYGG